MNDEPTYLQNYYLYNQEELLEKANEYYKNNKQQVLAQKAKKEKCDCGCIVAHGGMTRHKNSAKHKERMEQKYIFHHQV
tara:strand:- start:4928 stop:5164 length:237 start_codon:yes stop_codon:yes gene_type:complete